MVQGFKFGARRRHLLSGLPLAAAAFGVAGATPPVAAQENIPEAALPEERMRQTQAEIRSAKGTKIVLLGTAGGPVLGGLHRQPACVLYNSGHAYVLDCGLSVSTRYAQAGLRFDELKGIFITQQRPDHILGYGPFLAEGWIMGMSPDVPAYGPPGMTKMTTEYIASIQTMTNFWVEDFKIPPMKPIPTHELTAPGFVMKNELVRVTCGLENHPSVRPAFAYRFDFKDRSIVYASDTAPSASVAKLAKGADVLIHDAMLIPAVKKMIQAAIANGAKMSPEVFWKHMMADHTPVEKLGQIAQEAGVKTLVLYHLSPTPLATSPHQVMNPQPWIDGASKYFKGQIIFGEDLTVI